MKYFLIHSTIYERWRLCVSPPSWSGKPGELISRTDANWGTKTFFYNLYFYSLYSYLLLDIYLENLTDGGQLGNQNFFLQLYFYLYSYLLLYIYLENLTDEGQLGNRKENLELIFFFICVMNPYVFAFIDEFIYLVTSTHEWLLRKFSAFYFLFIIHYKSVYVYFYKRI